MCRQGPESTLVCVLILGAREALARVRIQQYANKSWLNRQLVPLVATQPSHSLDKVSVGGVSSL